MRSVSAKQRHAPTAESHCVWTHCCTDVAAIVQQKDEREKDKEQKILHFTVLILALTVEKLR